MKPTTLGNRKTSWKNKLFFLLGGIILVFVGTNLAKSWQKNNQINQEVAGLEENIQQLEKDSLELKELVEYFNSQAYIEEKARIDLGLKKVGEKVVIVTNSRGKNLSAQIPDQAAPQQLITSNPQRWWQYFFD